MRRERERRDRERLKHSEVSNYLFIINKSTRQIAQYSIRTEVQSSWTSIVRGKRNNNSRITSNLDFAVCAFLIVSHLGFSSACSHWKVLKIRPRELAIDDILLISADGLNLAYSGSRFSQAPQNQVSETMEFRMQSRWQESPQHLQSTASPLANQIKWGTMKTYSWTNDNFELHWQQVGVFGAKCDHFNISSKHSISKSVENSLAGYFTLISAQ